MKTLHKLLALLLILFVTLSAQESDLYQYLESLEGITFTKIKHDTNHFTEAYEIFVTQPIDHKNPEAGTFTQQVYLSHNDKDVPAIISTEGYAAGRNYTLELSRLFPANQLIVEHRYFEESVPEPRDWQYLTIYNAASDHHNIVEMFNDFYTGKWVNTGISKGGQTVMYHTYFYPEDVDVSVPYVAPLNFAPFEPRMYTFFKDEVSTPECRERVRNFQRLVLEKRDELYPMFLDKAKEKGYTYNIIGEEAAFEYAVFEYEFAYWQWVEDDCENIPAADDSLHIIFNHFEEGSSFSFFDDAGIKDGYPFYYQAYNEIGFYDYNVDHLKDLLKYADGNTEFFYPGDAEPWEFNQQQMYDVRDFLLTDGNNFIYIYGANDPWSRGTGVREVGETNSLLMVKEGGSHRTRIRHFEGEQKEKIYSTLEEWLDVEIER